MQRDFSFFWTIFELSLCRLDAGLHCGLDLSLLVGFKYNYSDFMHGICRKKQTKKNNSVECDLKAPQLRVHKVEIMFICCFVFFLLKHETQFKSVCVCNFLVAPQQPFSSNYRKCRGSYRVTVTNTNTIMDARAHTDTHLSPPTLSHL